MNHPVPDPFAGSTGKPSVSFAVKDEYGRYQDKPIGTSFTLKVASTPALKQVTNFDTQQPDTWPNGDPKMGVFVDVVDVNTGEELSLVARKPGGIFTAIQEAQAALGGHVLAIGDTLTLTFTGLKPSDKGNPFKIYSAVIQPGNAFEQAAAPATPVAQAPAAPVAAPAPVPAGPTAEQIAALRAAGIDPATVYPSLAAAGQSAEPPF